MFADAAECVYVGVIGVMIKVFVLFVGHLLRGGEFNLEGAYPSYSVVLATRLTSFCHLGNIRRRSNLIAGEIMPHGYALR
jgi:hypothetical protein